MADSAVVTFEPSGFKARACVGETILKVALGNAVGIRSECGQKGTCGKCKIIVKDHESVTGLSNLEKQMLSQTEIKSGYRLACQAEVLKGLTVMIPPESRTESLRILASGAERGVRLNPAIRKIHRVLEKPTLIDPDADLQRLTRSLGGRVYDVDHELLSALPMVLRDGDWDVTAVIWGDKRIIDVEQGDTTSRAYGLAIDLGTSTIVGHLVYLVTGATVAVESTENPQMVRGEDIITRLTYAMSQEGNVKNLQAQAIEGIDLVLQRACASARVDPKNVYEAVVVGNTAMHHLLLGLPTNYLARSPFPPATKSPLETRSRNIGLGISPCGILYMPPVVAGFVGSDAVADLLATGAYKSKSLYLVVDIGTNTEVMLGDSDGILACSCASGPAFEGGHISHGMRAVSGAIEKIRIDQDCEVDYETIGGSKPLGLCGSAVVDIVAEMFAKGIIDRWGRFNPKLESDRLRKDGQFEFVVARGNETATGTDITFTQKDVNEVLLAKAAICAAQKILLKRLPASIPDIERAFIAGAFGNYLDQGNAKVIGLLPDLSTEKIRSVGNAAVTGAKMALISWRMRTTCERLGDKIRYIELSVDPEFNKDYVGALTLPSRPGF